MTDDIEQRAEAYLRRIDDMGGALAAIEAGFIQREIQDAAYQTQQRIERGEEIIVGVNAYQTPETSVLERLQVDPAIERAQALHLVTVRARRDPVRVAELLGRLEAVARGRDNLMPLFIEAVEADITLGEICGLLRRAWGEYRPPATL